MPNAKLQIINTPENGQIGFDQVRAQFIRVMQKVTGLGQNFLIYEEPETTTSNRPCKPYMSMKITTPAGKSGDDSKDAVLDELGQPTTRWNTGGVRKMTVEFNSYGLSHEQAMDYMVLWQTALDSEDIQEDLRRYGIAVWVIGNVADLSKLLNTGFEGRSHLEVTFGIAVNYQADLGEIHSVPIEGLVDDELTISVTVEGP